MKKRTHKSSSDGYNDAMYIGMDLHKNFLQIAVMDNNGKLLENSRIENDHKHISDFFKNVNSDNTKVVMESSNGWYDTYRCLSNEKGFDVTLSNPIKTKAIASAKIKTDKVDAKVLADLLRGGYIAECYVPAKRVMELRELVRHREFLVSTRTRMKNKVHGILLMNGIRIEEKTSFSQRYIKKLMDLHNYRIDSYLQIIESLDGAISDVTRKIRRVAEGYTLCRQRECYHGPCTSLSSFQD